MWRQRPDFRDRFATVGYHEGSPVADAPQVRAEAGLQLACTDDVTGHVVIVPTCTAVVKERSGRPSATSGVIAVGTLRPYHILCIGFAGRVRHLPSL